MERCLFCLIACIPLIGCSAEPRPGSTDALVAGYKDLKLMTPEPVLVDPELTMLCVKPTAEQVRAAREASGPHAQAEINVYMNRRAAEAFEQRAERYPVGSIIVKEKLYLSEGLGGMIKRAAGYDPEHGDWEYFFKDSNGIETGRISSCRHCHSAAAARDYVFGDWKDGISALTGRQVTHRKPMPAQPAAAE